MKRRYSVTWSASATNELARLWTDNPAIRQEVTEAADALDSALAYEPASIGVSRGKSQFIVRLPLAVLFRIVEGDRQVRVIHVRHWLD